MSSAIHHIHDWRRTRLFGPIVTMAFGGLALVVLLSIFLIERFDVAAAEHERAIVQRGVVEVGKELDAVVATQVDWDAAIAALDNKFDPAWADFNLGNYLYTFNDFSHVYVINAAEQPIYAAVKGERTDISSFAAFRPVVEQLTPRLRSAESRRGAIKPRPGKNNILIPPIQANAFAKVGDQYYVVTATLVQPDFGKKLPKGPRAPITIAAKPVDGAMLKSFADRYLLEGIMLARTDYRPDDRQQVVLHGLDHRPLAALSWIPAKPGTLLRERLQVPLLVGVLLLALLAISVVRRGSTMVQELIASEQRSKHLAYHDLLTQLPNRALLFERLRALLAERGPETNALAVICVDLDRFKEVNDTLGHHAGDLLIQAVATRLREACPQAELIARLGGDEFVILHESTGKDVLDVLPARVLASVSERIGTEYGWLEVGCSLGVAVIDHAGVEPSEALRWADIALYRSKEAGRNRMTLFEPEMDEVLRTRLSLEADLRRAVQDGSLHMVYQPQVDRSGTITGVEALLRWDHAERGAVPPGVFVPLAEETGVILALGEFVLRRVFSETHAWQQARVAMNISAVQLRMPGFAALVTRLAAQAGIDPTRYEIELTETALLGSDPNIAANVEALKRLGFSLALDDFGTGYSSLSVLQRFAVDRIKIDRSFVNALENAGETGALVDSMLKLARAMNLSVIAEGVETEAQKERLVKYGCKYFQGHLTGHPLPADDVAQLLGEAIPPRRRAARR
ncbi:MAG: EAL domain-containing protein [Novosphingobium sp.]